jgi:hypothetical protein
MVDERIDVDVSAQIQFHQLGHLIATLDPPNEEPQR